MVAVLRGWNLCRREKQVLSRLLIGDSEKQVALALSISPETVHIYVKRIYRKFSVHARCELMALFIPPIVTQIIRFRCEAEARDFQLRRPDDRLVRLGIPFWGETSDCAVS